MIQGINVAEEVRKNPIYSLFYHLSDSTKSKICFFISHKNEDTDAAVELGNHIMNDFGYNIYLDIYDSSLQEADKNDDVDSIVKSIHKGLNYSTHLLCVVTDKSKESWWIPYEIGYAQAKNKKTASMKIKNSEYLPSFLRASDSKIFETIKELDEYLSKESLFEPTAPQANYIYFDYDKR